MNIVDYENTNMYVVFNSEDYKYIEDFESGYAATYHKNGVCGYIDTNGYEILLYDYIKLGDFCNFIAPVCKKINNNELWGFINNDFEEIIECKYYFYQRYYNYFIVKGMQSDEFIVIDELGKTAFSDKSKNECEAYININKCEISKTKSSIIKKPYTIPFSNISRYSYENDGERIIPYDNIENRDFCCGYVVVSVENGNYKVFNENGKQLKIHTCIKINAETMYLKDKIDKFNFRITSKVFDGYSSLIKIDEYEYILFGNSIEELSSIKEEFFQYIKKEKEKVKKIETN